MKNILNTVFCILTGIVFYGCSGDSSSPDPAGLWLWEGFTKIDESNPILSPGEDLIFKCPLSGREVKWEERNVLNPCAIVKDEKVYLLYRAQDETGTSRIGMAVSEDGIHFDKMKEPVFYPDEDEMKSFEWHYAKTGILQEGIDYFDGVEDPRIVTSQEGQYIMTYTSYDGKTARLSHAVSDDLITWKKQGLVLQEEKYKDMWSKAGAIVARMENGNAVAHQVNGKYWMYYGDTDLFMATSDDLIQWEAAENSENGQRISVLQPRKGFFDSRLVEPGPYALHLPEGIHMIYNASNAANFNDSSLPIYTYAPGQALFDSEMPYRLIDRSDSYLFKPDKPYEREGEVNEVCFVEGLVSFKGKWFLYYGTADSYIAVAVKNQ